MNKFDTGGGHYEPQGYMRVNAGGSHEENPNGGVQVGVDPEGAPNLLEEGEPVYNDYVYSDNIVADEEMLKKHSLPTKYNGKLYSEIADIFVDEAAETPFDPITNNGLNEMLVRLAESQEEQKAIQQQKELEEELANLSPEELEKLEMMLAEAEQPQEEMIPEQEMMQPEVPMMACGGRINKYEDGTQNLRRLTYNGDQITAQGRSTPFRLSGGANPYFWISRFPGILRGKVRSVPQLFDDARTSTAASSVADALLDPTDTLLQTALQERDAKADSAATAGTTAPVATKRRVSSPLKPAPGTIPNGYVVPDNFIKLMDAEEPGFGVNPGAQDIVAAALAKAQQEALPRPTTSPTINRDEAVRTIAANRSGSYPSAYPASPVAKEEAGDNGMLPVWPRYAGAVTSGLLGLYNAFQEPDKYTIPNYMPVLPQGRMHLTDPVYNPLDQNQVVNDVLASSAGTTRALNNAGLGASTGATLLAQDYNTGRVLGNALAQAREANNQRLNQVIAQRNQNASALANFDYGQSRDRAQILNEAARLNLQNEITRQRLNYDAESQKYAAIQNQIDSVAQALSNIGRENAAMNMINGDEAYAYALNKLFDTYYKNQNKKACGGKIKKSK